MRRKSAHRKALEDITLHPGKYGIRGVIFGAIEPNLYDDKGNQVAQPDLIFYCLKKEVYVVEYKSNGSEALRRKAESQLYNAVRWFNRQGIDPRTKIINGEYFRKRHKNSQPIKRNPRR